MPKFRYWVFRHAPVIDSSKIYGYSDIPAKSFRLDHEQLLNLNIPGSATIICSPLQRAVVAIKEIKSLLHLSNEVQFDERLKEQNFGILENSAFRQPDFKQRRPYMHFAPDYKPESGESYQELRLRTNDFMLDTIQPSVDMDYVICTHGGVVRAMLGYVLNLADPDTLAFDLKPLSLIMFEFKPNESEHQLWWIKTIGQNFIK